jgi:prefoldin subunit 5
MGLDNKLQNPKRSLQDPTELNARLTAIEKELAKLQERVDELELDKVKLGPARWGGVA